MERELRNALRNTVTRCRTLLEASVAEVLEGHFAIYPDGTSAARASLTHLSESDLTLRDDLLAQLQHIQATMLGGGTPAKGAVEQLVREVAFTHLNRLCAFKMLEVRKHMREAVGRGLASPGFKFYLADHEDDERLWSGGQQEVAYRHYLLALSAGLAAEVGPLFSPEDPANRLFPAHGTLMAVLDELNAEPLADAWSEDETIGWVYQYFTPKELRDKARKQSSAPRNSYELAFRNQFYTPRYVVEFLVDNTLGRTWYEMHGGETQLKERCQYLVYRPDEEYEPRATKDPRDFRILDPACGSGHFLLYAYDVLATIYEEAWADPESPPSAATGNSLQADYPDLAALKTATPALILAHNLHGIDIDLRSTQIAALALWLRAQRAYQELGSRQSERTQLPRPRIVVAEPMPGERELLQEFLRDLAEPRLGPLMLSVWEQMRLASEAGSLLQIGQHIEGALAAARHQAFVPQKPAKISLFEPGVPTHQPTLEFTVGKDEHEFWAGAQERLLSALAEYAKRASNGQSYLRRVFAENARQGFDFVEVSLERFDVVLMNPPFGSPSLPSKIYVEQTYPRVKNEVYAAFIERGLQWLVPRGILGAITSRAGFFQSGLQSWREVNLRKDAPPLIVADLGAGVMDTAMVEAAAYCLGKGESTSRDVTFLRAIDVEEKGPALLSALHNPHQDDHLGRYVMPLRRFEIIPTAPLAYWASDNLFHVFERLPPLTNAGRIARTTNPTTDDFRFARAWWEVNSEGLGSRWRSWNKGGGFAPYYRDIDLVIDWDDTHQTYNGYTGTIYRPDIRPANLNYFFRPGLTWSYRSPRLCLQVMPEGTIISTRGNGLYSDNVESLGLFDLGLLNSGAADALVKLALGRGAHPQFDIGDLGNVPVPAPDPKVGEHASAIWSLKRDLDRANEISHAFTLPAALRSGSLSLENSQRAWNGEKSMVNASAARHQAEIDSAALRLYGLVDEDIAIARAVAATSGEPGEAVEDPGLELEGDDVADSDAATCPAGLLSWSMGCVFGRFDIRIAGDGSLVPPLQGPFQRLPAYPPGLLVGPDGLPASRNWIASETWLRARSDSITGPPKGAVNAPAISDAEYPLSIDWDGILVDDAEHGDDVVGRVREVLQAVWHDAAGTVEHEASAMLGLKDIREWFRNPRNCWEDHIKRYSKSRRKAPIYWLLQSSKRSYALWLYYHRLDGDMLAKALTNYVEPKVRREESRLAELRAELAAQQPTGAAARMAEREIERQEALISELLDFRAALDRAAKLGLQPDLDDGVVLNIAPLHELVPWKLARQYWDELLAGKYEWSTISKQLRAKGVVR